MTPYEDYLPSVVTMNCIQRKSYLRHSRYGSEVTQVTSESDWDILDLMLKLIIIKKILCLLFHASLHVSDSQAFTKYVHIHIMISCISLPAIYTRVGQSDIHQKYAPLYSFFLFELKVLSKY